MSIHDEEKVLSYPPSNFRRDEEKPPRKTSLCVERGGAMVYIIRETVNRSFHSRTVTSMKQILQTSTFISVLLLCWILLFVHGKFNSDELDRKIIALFKIIDYVDRRPHQMNVDATLGITIAEANIAGTLLHENAGHFGKEYSTVFQAMLILLDRTRRYLIENVTPENVKLQLLHRTLNNPELWLRKISWRTGDLGEIPKPSQGLTYRSIVNTTMQGEPNENQSDRCLVEIVEEKLHGPCRISETCIEILTNKSPSRGYPLTHRLLIVELAKAVCLLEKNLDCQENTNLKFSDLITLYCSAILQDLIDIETTGFPYNTRDLMMEEVLLCGMEGFLEFTNKHYEKLILDWPHFSGCFSSFGYGGSRKKKTNPVRRTSLPMDFGCDSHATGLAAATLSLYIRENIENTFN